MGKTAAAQPAPAVQKAITRALPMLQKSAETFVAERACFSCHHNGLSILTLHRALERGFDVDRKVLAAVEEKTFRPLTAATALDDAIQAINLSDPTPNDSLLLMAAQAAGQVPDMTTAVFASRIVRWQRDDHWVTSDFRPPHSSSLFMTTATAVRAIASFYSPPELRGVRDAAVAAARRWLFATRYESTEDAAFRVMGLVWAGASSDEIRSAARDLQGLQKPNGGWAQLPDYDSDAYSTGESLVALRAAGVAVSDLSWQKGLKFLISNQASDGTWHVRTRMISPAEVSPPYFTTGFPYAKDEFLSYAGSCWAVMALLSAMPETLVISTPPSIIEQAPSSPFWARVALFGSARELETLLDSGLDANSTTANGTTLLMMSVTDPAKVQLLIRRGANVGVRSGSGTDAITIAAAYRGTTPSLQLLLNAGAEAQAAPGVRVRHSPIVFASMTGDLENVRVLLARGAKPSFEGLSEAVTFGYPEIVRTFIDAGVDARTKGNLGINLLHWATISNRSTVIPVLAAARVPVDALDDFGLTPLMYAALLDNGNTAALKELLKAGADRRLRDPDGRTSLDLARRYKHSRLAEQLK